MRQQYKRTQYTSYVCVQVEEEGEVVLDDEDEGGVVQVSGCVVFRTPRSSYSLNASMEPILIIVLGVMPFRCSILS